jgi:hypothetical protein
LRERNSGVRLSTGARAVLLFSGSILSMADSNESLVFADGKSSL